MLDIEVFGRCPVPPGGIGECFERNGPRGLLGLEGDFVIRLRRGGEEWVVGSPGGIYPYFYTRRGESYFHADSVKGVLEASGLAWEWCWEALGDLLAFDQLMGEHTLHREVLRFPPAGVLHLEGGRGSLAGGGGREELLPRLETSPEAALQAFNDAVGRDASDDSLLSVSGGFDSRAILSSLLRQGVRPELICMGQPESMDVAVSRRIAAATGLSLEVVPLLPEDYLEFGEDIVSLTGGAKTAEHWHTYIYLAKAAPDRERPFFVGVNGEFARCKSMDYGMPVKYLNLPSRRLLNLFWRAHTRVPFSGREMREGLDPRLACAAGPEGTAGRLDRLSHDCPAGFLDALQFQYYAQRVRNFVGYGMRLYGEWVSWRAPFLDRAWLRQAWNLPHAEKLGSNWHRYCIERNYPELMGFPVTAYLEVPASRASCFYRRPWRRLWRPRVPYAACSSWFAQAGVVDFLHGNLALIDDLIDRETARRVIEEHRRGNGRTRAVSWMLAMCMLRLTHA